MRLLATFIFSFLLTFSVALADVLNDLQNKMRNVGTVKSDFVLTIKYKDFGDKDVYGGKITLNKKGQILVKYRKNYNMIIYVNGNTVKYYNPEEDEVYTKKVKNEFYLQLFQTFIKNGDIRKFFKDTKEVKLKNGDYKLVLIPKKKYKEDGLEKAVLVLDKNLQLKRLTLFTEDSTMDYKFKNQKYYKKVIPLRFSKNL